MTPLVSWALIALAAYIIIAPTIAAARAAHAREKATR